MRHKSVGINSEWKNEAQALLKKGSVATKIFWGLPIGEVTLEIVIVAHNESKIRFKDLSYFREIAIANGTPIIAEASFVNKSVVQNKKAM